MVAITFRREHVRLAFAAIVVSATVGCLVHRDAISGSERPLPPAVVKIAPAIAVEHEDEAHGPRRHALDGRAFPDGVLALTWDDGPDVETLALARYLHRQRVSGTFFVVGSWIDGVSDEPGEGRVRWATGTEHLPILAELSALGHRLGDHTKNHTLLSEISGNDVERQLTEGQRAIDPFITNELRIFRAPGGAFSAEASRGTESPFLDDLVGPLRWDIDAKDWDGSLHCRGAPASECEPSPVAPNETRVRPSVMAKRYLAKIERQRHGIVLLHDRVGAVGTRYALDVAMGLVPELERRGYVFAGPVLSFSTLRRRGDGSSRDAFTVDLDGDGRVDLCAPLEPMDEPGRRELRCALAHDVDDHDGESSAHRHVAMLDGPRPFTNLPSRGGLAGGDVDGDGRADVCSLDEHGSITCALAKTSLGELTSFEPWGEFETREGGTRLAQVIPESLRLADVDGDGVLDACAILVNGEERLLCAHGTKKRFQAARAWLRQGTSSWLSRAELRDLDGDRRADVCLTMGSPEAPSVQCALSNGRAFVESQSFRLEARAAMTFALGDINGDGRADVCTLARTPVEGHVRHDVMCALASRHGLRAATTWATTTTDARSFETMRLFDLTHDSRDDLCLINAERVDCAVAP